MIVVGPIGVAVSRLAMPYARSRTVRPFRLTPTAQPGEFGPLHRSKRRSTAMAVESKGSGVCARVAEGLPNKRRPLLSRGNAFTTYPSFGGGEPRRELLTLPIDDRVLGHEAIG